MPRAPILGNREHYRPAQGSVRPDCGLVEWKREVGRRSRRRGGGDGRSSRKERKGRGTEGGGEKRHWGERRGKQGGGEKRGGQSLGLHGLLSQHRAADRAAADIYSCHARLPLAGPRRAFARGLAAFPWLESLSITGLDQPQHLSSLCKESGPRNSHRTSIKHRVAGESERLQHSTGALKTPL